MTQQVDLNGSVHPAAVVSAARTDPAEVAEVGRQIAGAISQVLLGKPEVVRLAVICMLTEGHLLIEDVPGTGKTCWRKHWRSR